MGVLHRRGLTGLGVSIFQQTGSAASMALILIPRSIQALEQNITKEETNP